MRDAGRAPALPLALFLLFMLNTLNFLDRMLFGVTQELIKRDLLMNDFALGLIGGPSFAIVYVLSGLVIARWAERGNRVRIAAGSLALWSVMTALCGAASSFWHLALARAGVSVGEGGGSPAAHSLISDYFPERRAGALAVYASGGPVGTILAAIGGGFLAAAFGWRMAFLSCALLGLLVALAFVLSLPEPRRTSEPGATPPFAQAARTLLAKPAFRHATIAGSLAAFGGFGISQYLVSFLIRAHGLSLAEAGLRMGLITGGVSLIGTIASGTLIDRGRARFSRIGSWLPACGLFTAGIAYPLSFLSPDIGTATTLLIVAAGGQGTYTGALYALAQDVAPPTMRATAAAIVVGTATVLGSGLGPPLLGLASDHLASLGLASVGLSVSACAHGAANEAQCAAGVAQGLRYALVLVSLVFLWAAVHFALCARTILSDIWKCDRPAHRRRIGS